MMHPTYVREHVNYLPWVKEGYVYVIFSRADGRASKHQRL